MRVQANGIRIVACAMFAIFVVIASVGQTHAQQNSSVASFLANPSQILTQNPDQLRVQVAGLATADPATLSVILSLLSTATKEQKDAIGKGLGDAAKNVLATNQAYSTQIQTAIIQTRDDEVRVAFTNTLGDVRLGGILGGGGLGGGGGGQTNPQGNTPTTTGPAQPIGTPGTNTGLFSYNSSVSGSSGFTTTFSSVSQ